MAERQTLLMEEVLGETRLAVIEDGALCELYAERPGLERLEGSLYLGRVENVLPGMNAAFVDIGLEKKAFLCAGDVRPELRGEPALEARAREARIERLVRPGQTLLVQVVKAGTGGKGPRVSSGVALPGRALVLMPDVSFAGVSRKIADPDERARLSAAASALAERGGMGLIVRTAAEGMETSALAEEHAALAALWQSIRTRAEHGVAPRLLYAADGLALRAVRDLLGEDTDALWVDGPELWAALREQARTLAPRWADRVRLHEGETPLFDLYRVDDQADKALRRFVWLKSGGSLVIDETEALTVIDVNTGKFVGKKSLEDTIYRNNREAAREIMRQLRLRDIGGIVVVDFIDMEDPGRKQALLEELRALAARDRSRVRVVGLTGLGLVEMTRKRARASLRRQLLHTCSACGGDGLVPAHETTARRAARELWRRRRRGENGPLLVEAAAPVAGRLRAIGAPEGGRAYVLAVEDAGAGEYRVAPADESRLPEACKLLK